MYLGFFLFLGVSSCYWSSKRVNWMIVETNRTLLTRNSLKGTKPASWVCLTQCELLFLYIIYNDSTQPCDAQRIMSISLSSPPTEVGSTKNNYFSFSLVFKYLYFILIFLHLCSLLHFKWKRYIFLLLQFQTHLYFSLYSHFWCKKGDRCISCLCQVFLE